MRMLGDFFLADSDQVLGTADHAACGSANLEMCNFANRLQLEHEVERGYFERADIIHTQHIGHMFDGGTAKPALLFLRPPQQRDDAGGLTPLGEFGQLRFGPFPVGGREGETRRLFVVQTTEH